MAELISKETLIKSLPWSKNGKMKENNSGW